MKNTDIPSIIIITNVEYNSSEVIKAICNGIEEEGIPYDIEVGEETKGEKLCYKASLQSRLDVGIGISSEGFICVHYAKMQSDTPLIKLDAFQDLNKLKTIGINAARLVKGIPFK